MELYLRDNLRQRFIDRFWAKVCMGEPDECWPWTARTNTWGYGVISCPVAPGKHRDRNAHRIAYLLSSGDPGALDVCHTCDVRICCNPAHLWLGTNQENTADRDAKGRMCSGDRWHAAHDNSILRGEEHPMAVLSVSDVAAISARLSDGENCRVIAEDFGVDRSTVSMIRRGKTWRMG